MNANTYLRQLRNSWPVCSVGTDEEINGGDVVEWLGTLQAQLDAALSGAEFTRGNAEIREAIRAAGGANFDSGEWNPGDSEEPYCDVNARAVVAERYLFALLGISPDAPGAATVHSPADLVRQARMHLRLAREALKAAGAPRAADRVRAAIRSADGAQRHADLAPYRQARQDREAGI